VRGCATALGVPFSEVTLDQFADPYQVTRVLKALLEAPRLAGPVKQAGWVEKVMKTKILELPN
jgi:hypothetical protein